MTAHISARIAWHQNGWNGRVCQDPAANVYCVGRHSIPAASIWEDVSCCNSTGCESPGRGFETRVLVFLCSRKSLAGKRLRSSDSVATGSQYLTRDAPIADNVLTQTCDRGHWPNASSCDASVGAGCPAVPAASRFSNK